MTSVALTSPTAPLLQAKAPARDAQRMTGFGILLGTGAELEATSFGQIFAPTVLSATKMPFHTDNLEPVDAVQSEGAGPALEEVVVNPTVTLPALTVREGIGFEQVEAPPVLPTRKTLLLSNSADILEGAQLEGAETPLRAMLVDPVEQVTMAATETMSTLQSAQTVGADASLLVAGGSGNLRQTTQAAPVVDQIEFAGEALWEIEPSALPLAWRPNAGLQEVAMIASAPDPINASKSVEISSGKPIFTTLAPNMPMSNVALPVIDAPASTIVQSGIFQAETVQAATGSAGLIAQTAVSVAPKPPRPHLTSVTAQVTPQIGSAPAALSAELEPDLTSSSAVSVNQVTIPTEVTQLVAATSGPLGKVLPKQTPELTFAASESLATKIVDKSSGVPTLVEAVAAKPQVPLEWYSKAVNVDTFRATNISPSLPIHQAVPPPSPALEPLATDLAVRGKHRFAEAITAQIKSVVVTQERTHIALNPRGLGSIDIEISQSADSTLKVTIRAENPVVLQALRDERNLLAQAIGFESGATLEFHQQARDNQAGTDNSDQGSNQELQAGEAKGEMSVKEKVEVIAHNQLDITT